MSKILEEARAYERAENAGISEEGRPIFHFSNPVGWMNDPNGFSEYRGEHHLFFQYHPYATRWGSVHWGHAKSKDFIKWEYLPAALAPDRSYDSSGVFSGSALEDEGQQLLIYTGVEERVLENGEKSIRQHQCIALGDGLDYKKHERNPVVSAAMLPKGSSMEDFRDPKIWKEDGKYYMVVGSRSADGSGQIALFCADSLDNWSFAGILDQSKNQIGKMWECPDFFSLDEKQVLMISFQEMEAEELEFHNGNNAAFLIGSYEKEGMRFTREKLQNVDYGLDFYAPQTMLTEDGRRIMIGWMQSWDNPMYPDTQSWSGIMSIPRELSLRDGRICQWPVHELEAYRKNLISYTGLCMERERKLDGIRGRNIDLELVLRGKEYKNFKIKLAADERRYTEIIYDREAEILSFDRTYSGLRRDLLCTRSMRVKSKEDVLRLRILVDSYSVEIFVNNGEQAMSSLIYTPLDASEIRFSSSGRALMDIKKYEVKSPLSKKAEFEMDL